jgi:hypothetical protein
MTTKTTTFQLLATGLVLLALAVATPSTALAALDGSTPMLCAVTTVMECDVEGKCQRITPQLHPDFPAFLRLNVPQKTITAGGAPDGRKSEIKAVSRLDGRLILHGGENGRGWAATIAEDTGRMSAGIVTDEFAFTLFGTCTAS